MSVASKSSKSWPLHHQAASLLRSLPGACWWGYCLWFWKRDSAKPKDLDTGFTTPLSLILSLKKKCIDAYNMVLYRPRLNRYFKTSCMSSLRLNMTCPNLYVQSEAPTPATYPKTSLTWAATFGIEKKGSFPSFHQVAIIHVIKQLVVASASAGNLHKSFVRAYVCLLSS